MKIKTKTGKVKANLSLRRLCTKSENPRQGCVKTLKAFTNSGPGFPGFKANPGPGLELANAFSVKCIY